MSAKITLLHLDEGIPLYRPETAEQHLQNISVQEDSNILLTTRNVVEMPIAARACHILFKPHRESESASEEVAVEYTATFEEALAAFASVLQSRTPSDPLLFTEAVDTFSDLGPLGMNNCELRPRGGHNSTGRDPDCYGNFEVRRHVDELVLSLHWEDQGWGNRKGQCGLRLLSADGVLKAKKDNVLGLCLHEMTRASVLLKRGTDELVDKIQPGDKVCVWFTRGDGEGHKLTVEDFRLDVRYVSEEPVDGAKGCAVLAYHRHCAWEDPAQRFPAHEEGHEEAGDTWLHDPSARRASGAVDPMELHKRLSHVVSQRGVGGGEGEGEGEADRGWMEARREGGEGKGTVFVLSEFEAANGRMPDERDETMRGGAREGERVEVAGEVGWRELKEWAMRVQESGGGAVEVELQTRAGAKQRLERSGARRNGSGLCGAKAGEERRAAVGGRLGVVVGSLVVGAASVYAFGWMLGLQHEAALILMLA